MIGPETLKAPKTTDFYQDHLDRVSRSFAFCIRRLEAPLRHWVSLSYLLCRILDTVEDARWASSKDQQLAFRTFADLLSSKDHLAQANDWALVFPESLPKGERDLLESSHRVFQDFHDLPTDAREVIQSMVSWMSGGMQHFGSQKAGAGLRLSDMTEVNQYCFFVAGVVGEALTGLMGSTQKAFSNRPQALLGAYHFGLFLQKVNLLKDQSGDESEGRFLVPDPNELWRSLSKNAKGAKEYFDSLPFQQTGYRLFCAWSLYLGLASLPYISIGKKIPRWRTLRLTQEIEKSIAHPMDLNRLYQRLYQEAGLQEVRRADAVREVGSVEPWVLNAYSGSLTALDFVELGMVRT